MIVKSSKEIIEEFLEAYNRDPKGWHVLYGFDKESRLNLYIGKKNENSIWAILTEPHFGVGMRIDDTNIEEFFKKESEFGLRQISASLGERILKDFFEYGTLTATTAKRLIEETKTRPRTVEELEKAKFVATGPYVKISIQTVDERIRSKLQLEFKKRLKERLSYIV
jgi:hypothetical protein